MVEAIRLATADAGLTSLPSLDALRVVGLLSWRYGNPAWLIAQDLGVSSREYALSAMGGNTPQSLVNTAATEIQNGQADIIVLTGGDSTRTKARAKKAGTQLTWRKTNADAPAPTAVGEDLVIVSEYEIQRKILMPVQVYPMFETAIRARAGRSVQDHQKHISELW